MNIKVGDLVQYKQSPDNTFYDPKKGIVVRAKQLTSNRFEYVVQWFPVSLGQERLPEWSLEIVSGAVYNSE